MESKVKEREIVVFYEFLYIVKLIIVFVQYSYVDLLIFIR